MQEAFCKRLALFQETPGVVNWHEHVWFDESGKLDEARLDQMMEHSAMLGVDSLVISLPVIWGEAVPALVTKCNDAVSQAVKKYPGRLYGMCFVNPGYAAFSMREIERCIEELGFVGIKLYNQYFISDPVLRGVLEKSIAYDIPVLEHACKLNMFADSQPFASNGVHFAKAAEEYPEARMILAHIGGGGDWNWQVKAIEPYPNVAVDMSGNTRQPIWAASASSSGATAPSAPPSARSPTRTSPWKTSGPSSPAGPSPGISAKGGEPDAF